MSEVKFTPGPWRAVRQKDHYSDKCKLYVCYGEPDAVNPDVGTFPPDQCICGCGRSDQETEANARLISVAPRMYEELKASAFFLKEAEKFFKKRCGDIAIVGCLGYVAGKMEELVKEVEGDNKDE